MAFLSVRLDPESGLQAPTVLEAQHADKHIWQLISELCESTDWPLDDVLLEFTQNRGDLSALLQPRPKIAKPTATGNFQASGMQKGAKSSKGSGKLRVSFQETSLICTRNDV